jgi:hypothetical protein
MRATAVPSRVDAGQPTANRQLETRLRLDGGQRFVAAKHWVEYRRLEAQLRFAEVRLAAIAREAKPEVPQQVHSFRLSSTPQGSYRGSLAKALAFFKGLVASPISTGPDGQLTADGDSAEPAAPLYSPLSWQTKAAAHSDDRFLKLIISSPLGRSGSTLLQRICNARKKTLIWGEHGGAIWRFAHIYRDMAEMTNLGRVDREKYFAANEDPNQWIASMNPDLGYVQQAVADSARTLLNTLYGEYAESHDILGFKEIRYGRGEIELLRKCYPEADILLLVRHPCDTWSSTSRDWPYSLEEWTTLWQANADCYADLSQGDPHCHLIRYEELVGKEGRVMASLEDLAQVTEEQIANVLAHKIGSTRFGCSDSDREMILDRCGATLQKLGYR